MLGRCSGADSEGGGSRGGSERKASPGSQGASGRFKLAPSRMGGGLWGATARAGAADNSTIATTVDNNKVRLNMGYLFPLSAAILRNDNSMPVA